jgi:hypothetical protein
MIIFGWNHEKITSYGSVEQHQCPNCHNTAPWELKKISRYFTLFFIPVFPHDTFYWYHCPVCNQGVQIDQTTFEDYKMISRIREQYAAGEVTEEEASRQLQAVHDKLNAANDAKNAKLLEESKKWEKLASEKTDEELVEILRERHDYDPAFVIAVENELSIRKNN